MLHYSNDKCSESQEREKLMGFFFFPTLFCFFAGRRRLLVALHVHEIKPTWLKTEANHKMARGLSGPLPRN